MSETITYGDLLTVLPFGNTADIIEIKGEHLLLALEHGLTKWNPQDPAGRFLQMSGLYLIIHDIYTFKYCLTVY